MNKQHTHILCLETATDVCSIAITQNEKILAERRLSGSFKHSSGMIPLIQALCAELELPISHLDAIAVSNGPGSYTGLRVGLSTAKALCYGLDIPLIAISTLRALAAGMKSTTLLMPTIDARRMEVYTAIYDDQLNVISHPQNLIYTEDTLLRLVEDHGDITICGNGASKLLESDIELPQQLWIKPNECSASYLCVLAYERFCAEEFVDIAYHVPFYYKSPNVSLPRSVF